MKIMIITGSPKPNGGTSSLLVELLKNTIISHKPDAEFVTYNIRSNFIPETEYDNLENYNALVIATPLYIDSLPSHVLSQLSKLHEYLNSKKGEKSKAKNNLKIYALINCGFLDAKYTTIATRIIRMWAIKSGLVYASSLGIGGGEMISKVSSKSQINLGPLKPVKLALDNFAEIIAEEKCTTNNYCSPGIPRWMFIQAANSYFCKDNAKKSGLTLKQLYYQIP